MQSTISDPIEPAEGALRIFLDPACNGCKESIPWFNNHLDEVTGSILISPQLTDPKRWPPGPASAIAPPRDRGSGTLEKLFKHAASFIDDCFGAPPHQALGGLDYHLLSLNRARGQHPGDDLCTFVQRDEVVVALTQFCDVASTLCSVIKLSGPLEFPLDQKSEYKLRTMRFNATGAAFGTVAFYTDPTYKVVTGFTLIMQEESQPVMFSATSTLESESSISSNYSSIPGSSDP
jgi:hypothetical protein